MPFGVAAAGIGAAAGLAGAAMQSGAISGASKAAQDQWKQARQDLLPWQQAGQPALTATNDLLGLNGPDAASAAMARFQTSPGYTWSLGQGLRAVDAGAAAKGMLRSGATLKAETEFGQGLADQEFSNYWNRLSNLSGQGLDAARAIAGVGGDAARGSLATGNAQSSIYGNTLSGLSGTVNNLLGNKDFQSWVGGGGGGIDTSGASGNYFGNAGGSYFSNVAVPGVRYV